MGKDRVFSPHGHAEHIQGGKTMIVFHENGTFLKAPVKFLHLRFQSDLPLAQLVPARFSSLSIKNLTGAELNEFYEYTT